MVKFVTACVPAMRPSASDRMNEPKPSESDAIQRLALEMGSLYQSACLWSDLDQPKKSDEAMKRAMTAARALNVTLPRNPDWSGMPNATQNGSIAESIESTHDTKAAAAFALGFLVRHGLYGSILGVDTKSVVHSIERAAFESNFPEDMWRAGLDAIDRDPSATNFNSFLNDLLRR